MLFLQFTHLTVEWNPLMPLMDVLIDEIGLVSSWHLYTYASTVARRSSFIGCMRVSPVFVRLILLLYVDVAMFSRLTI